MKSNLMGPIKYAIFSLLIFILCVICGCSTYYTKLFLIGAPSDDLFDPEEIFNNFHGWDFYLSISGAYLDPNKERVQGDSFFISLTAEPIIHGLLLADSIEIKDPFVTLKAGNEVLKLKIYSRYNAGGHVHINYNYIYIPKNEALIKAHFEINVIKADGQRFIKEWQSELYRYEKKEKGPSACFLGA